MVYLRQSGRLSNHTRRALSGLRGHELKLILIVDSHTAARATSLAMNRWFTGVETRLADRTDLGITEMLSGRYAAFVLSGTISTMLITEFRKLTDDAMLASTPTCVISGSPLTSLDETIQGMVSREEIKYFFKASTEDQAAMRSWLAGILGVSAPASNTAGSRAKSA